MRFILNEGLTEEQPRNPFNPDMPFGCLNQELLTALVGTDWDAQRSNAVAILRTPDIDSICDTQKGYLQILSSAYSLHRKVTLNPHDIWYLVVSEIAAMVAENQDACRPLFTKSVEKITISVPTDDVTTIDLGLIEDELRRLVPMDMDQFLPEFSTITPQARYAMLAAFCESASHYYSYSTFMCGIPEIKIEGTTDDWALLKARAIEVSNTFSGVGLHALVGSWLDRVCGATDNILAALDTGRPDTLQNIFTQSRVGSGSQLKIDGWFADFYRKTMRGVQLEGFPNTWAKVPYENLETGRKFVGIHGCLLSRRDEDGFVSGDYGEIIVEKVEREVQTSGSFGVQKVEVKAASRTLNATYTLEKTQDASTLFSNPTIAELAAALEHEQKNRERF